MILNQQKNIALSIVLLILTILFYSLSSTSIKGVDDKAKEYYESSLKKAVIAYASIRGLNAVVSVIKESNLEIAPAGLGVNLAVGQILDPIDDMIERLSDVLIVAIVALGTERVIMEIGNGLSFQIISLLTFLLIGLIWINHKYGILVKEFIIKVILMLLIIRFFLPISSFLNTYINTNYLDKQITSSQEKLDSINLDNGIGDFKTTDIKNSGFLGQLTGTIKAVKIKTEQLQNIFTQIKQNGEDLIKAMLTLTTVYIVAFVLQVLIIPIGIFWSFIKLSGLFIRRDISGI